MIKKRRPLFSVTSLLREVICSIYICYSNKIIDGIVKNWNVYKISIRDIFTYLFIEKSDLYSIYICCSNKIIDKTLRTLNHY